MVGMRNGAAKAYTTYYLRPGQTLENTKPSERALALVLPRSVYEGFYEKVHENERFALLAEREAKRLAALKEATRNMSKAWEDTAQNIQKRRREELLNRRKVEEAARIKFTKEMAVKNAEERAKLVKQAKELLLYRKPQCRLINRALVVSECYKELEAQLESRKSIKKTREQLRAEEARAIREDVEKFREEEEKKREARLNKLKLYRRELEKQIKINERNLKNVEESIRKREVEDARNMSREMEEIKEKERQQLAAKKERLKTMFLEAIEEKTEQDLKIKQEEEFQEKSLNIYRDYKEQMAKAAKEKAKAAKENKIRRAEMLGKKFAKIADSKRLMAEKEDKKKEDIEKSIVEKCKRELLELLELEKQKKEQARLEMREEMSKCKQESKVKKKEEQDSKLWETLQRYKRDEFNKEWNLQKLEEEKSKKSNYARILKKQMEENEAERKKAVAEADDSAIIKKMIDNENEKILAYGEKVLKESRGLRPIYPIAKAVEEFKREVGLIPPFKKEDDYEVGAVAKKKRGRRTYCKSADEENVFYFA